MLCGLISTTLFVMHGMLDEPLLVGVREINRSEHPSSKYGVTKSMQEMLAKLSYTFSLNRD